MCAAGLASSSVKSARASVVQAYAADGIAHQRVGRMCTKWAKYEHRSHTGSMAMHISAHECNLSHKLARDSLCRPETHLALAPLLQPEPKAAASGAVTEAAGSSAVPEAATWGAAAAVDAASARKGLGMELAATSDLFKGRVPQVQEWLDAWADISSGVSFLKQGEISRKRHGADTKHKCRFQRKKWQA